jgi:hypothetical protein
MGWLKRHPLVWLLPLVGLAAAVLYVGKLAKAEATTSDTAIDYQI